MEGKVKKLKFMIYYLIFSIVFLLFFTAFVFTGYLQNLAFESCRTYLNRTPEAIFNPFKIQTEEDAGREIMEFIGKNYTYTVYPYFETCIGYLVEVRMNASTGRFILCKSGYLYRFVTECTVFRPYDAIVSGVKRIFGEES